MAKRTLRENINQVINDLNEIKSAIETKGVEVPAGTPTRDYGEKILNIETGVDVSADTVVAAALRAGFTAHEASGAAITGIIQNYEGAIVSGATPGAQAKYEEGYADGQASMPDLSKDTVTAEKLVLGETAHDASGQPVTGTLDTEAIRAEGIEAGKKSEYDAFWDAYQLDLHEDNYDFAFSGKGWNNSTFKPKHSIKPTRTQYMFSSCGVEGDLSQMLEERGVSIDTSNAIYMNQMFSNASKLTRVPHVDLSNAVNYYMENMFSACTKLETIDRITVKKTTLIPSNLVNACTSLKNLTIGGIIGDGHLNTSWSPLSKASIMSIINALSDTTTGLTVTLRLDAVNTAFETSAGAADGSTSEEWLALAATKPNWTINLINS